MLPMRRAGCNRKFVAVCRYISEMVHAIASAKVTVECKYKVTVIYRMVSFPNDLQ